MININGKEYRNIQEQVEKNKEDIEALQDSVTDVYTKDESDAKFQDKLTAGDNIAINSSNEISVDSEPTFENVVIDNDNYYSNNYQGTVIKFNTTGSNDDGHIKMNFNNPELYAYNDHLHGEYGNESTLKMLEDIRVSKSGYSDYPDGYYSKSYDLIDTLEDHDDRLDALETSSTNYATTNTDQTISGQKTYTNNYYVTNDKKVSFYDNTVDSYDKKTEIKSDGIIYTTTGSERYKVKETMTIGGVTYTEDIYFPRPTSNTSRTIALEDFIPAYRIFPDFTTDGTYVLEATVSNGTVVYNWVLKQ